MKPLSGSIKMKFIHWLNNKRLEIVTESVNELMILFKFENDIAVFIFRRMLLQNTMRAFDV
jgi:hypothetical protein